MNSHFYTAASGMIAEERRIDLIANNLANLSTSGYRAQRAFNSVYRGAAARAGNAASMPNQGVSLAGTYETPGQGQLRPTGRALDVALRENEFLEVQTGSGKRYVRAGSLDISDTGTLVNLAGHPLLDAAGETIEGASARTEITADGRVKDGGIELGRLNVVRDEARTLEPQGNQLYAATGRAPESVAEPELMPGWLEGSGTDALGELIQLIDSQRAFEGYQKLVSMTMNEVNRRAINDIAG